MHIPSRSDSACSKTGVTPRWSCVFPTPEASTTSSMTPTWRCPFTEEHDYNASRIVRYRTAPDVPEGYEFKTQWEDIP